MFPTSASVKFRVVRRGLVRGLFSVLAFIRQITKAMAAPLRRIITREVSVCQPKPNYSIYSLIDTLECGHFYESYLFNGIFDLVNAYQISPEISAKRRRCRPCAALVAKKQPTSVGLSAIVKQGVA